MAEFVLNGIELGEFTLMKGSRYTNESINLTLRLLRSIQPQRPFEDRLEAEIAEGIFEV